MKALSKLFSLFLAVAFIALFTTAAFSLGEETTVSGVVSAVDVENNSLTIKKDITWKELSFTIDPESTVIKKGEDTISLADIQVGDLVEVKLNETKVISITVKGK